jgi:predicted DNA-binding WGR domain protein
LKLIRQTRLFFQEGTSDKVYEIDLYESGDGYIVNFRFGRRGSTLKEGTKTIFPVSLGEAEKVFAELEQEKRKKGYVAEGEAQLKTGPATSRSKAGTEKRKKAILRILKAAAEGDEPENWPVSRVIWRAGDLKISEAVPVAIKISENTDDTFTLYSTVYTAARCGSANALPFLERISSNKNLPEYLTKLAFTASLLLSGEQKKAEMLDKISLSLPAPLLSGYQQKNYRELETQLDYLLFELKTASNQYLNSIYLLSLSDSNLQAVFQRILNKIPVKRNYFTYLRSIFKTAEMLEDSRTYGILTKIFDKYPPEYRTSYWTSPGEKKASAFSDKTRNYLSRRVVRFLNHFGNAETDSYIRLATGILSAFDDETDLTKPYQNHRYEYVFNEQTRRHSVVEQITWFDEYSGFNAFNFILYKNSQRYVKVASGWKCVPPYKPGEPAPQAREEAFPHLWNQAPAEIIKLLGESNSFRVTQFAMKVFHANPDFENTIDTSDIINFLSNRFPVTQELGFTLAVKKYNPSDPDKLLLTALLNSALPAARLQARQWISESRTTLLEDTDFVFNLLTSENPDAHNWLRTFLTIYTFSAAKAEITAARVIAMLVTLEVKDKTSEEHAKEIGDTLLIVLGEYIKNINLEIISDLFRHSSPVIHAIAGKILLRHEIKPELLPSGFLETLLNSAFIDSRNIGLDLLSRYPDKILLEKKDQLVSFCLSVNADVRNSVRPIIRRLAQTYPSFAEELVNLFVPAILMKESYEGVHDDLLALLCDELKENLKGIGKARALLLSGSKFRAAQTLGAEIVLKHIDPAEFTLEDLIKLADNPVETVRKYAFTIFNRSEEKIKSRKETAIRITDSDWDDTRKSAFEFFRSKFSPADWKPEILVAVTDSIRPDVQDFGREMIAKNFHEEQGQEFLLKLSQHPVASVQLFATSFLEKYAGGNPERITQLRLFFITLLSQVNKGKVAKARTMDFLKKEALKNESVATVAAEIFTRVSLSVAITEKAECILALREIRKKFPFIDSPAAIKDYPDYIKK